MAGFNPIMGELRGGWLRRVGKLISEHFNATLRFGRPNLDGRARKMVAGMSDEHLGSMGFAAGISESSAFSNLLKESNNSFGYNVPTNAIDKFTGKRRYLMLISSSAFDGFGRPFSGRFGSYGFSVADMELISTVNHELGHLAIRNKYISVPLRFSISNFKHIFRIASQYNLSYKAAAEELFVESAARKKLIKMNQIGTRSVPGGYDITHEIGSKIGYDIDFDALIKNGLRGPDHGKNAHGAIQGMMPNRPDFKGARTPGNPDSSSVIDSVKRFFVGESSIDVGSMNKSVHELADDVLVQASKKAKKASKEALGLYSMAPGGVKSAVKVGGVLAVGVGALSLIRGMFERERDAQPVSFDATQLINAKKDPGRYYPTKSR